jgi:predicted TPR repeat methyltransferase
MSKSLDKAKEKARQLAQANKLPKARSVLESVSRSAGGDGDFWSLLGLICSMTSDYEAAEAALSKAVDLIPGDAALRNNFGTVLKFQDKLDQAQSQYAESLRLQPGYVGAMVNLGALLVMKSEFSQAEDCLQQAIVRDPNNAEALNNLGLAQRGVGKDANAIASFQQALSLAPGFIDALVNLGVSCQFLDRLDQAQTCFQNVLGQYPDHVEALFNLGFVHNKAGRVVEAEAAFRRVIELSPGHTNAQYYLSIMGVEDAPEHSPAEYVKDLFDMYAEKFDDHLVKGLGYQTPSLIDRLLRTQLDSVEARYDILDLGCGTGLCGQLCNDLARSMVGVDLSPKMLDKARLLNVYDELLEQDVVECLQQRVSSFDVILSGDVFVYIGELSATISACSDSLRDNGLLVFSVERASDADAYVLRESGRYAQSRAYIDSLAVDANLKICTVEDTILRKENGKDIHGMVYVMSKG